MDKNDKNDVNLKNDINSENVVNDKNVVSVDDEDRPLAVVRSKPRPKSLQKKSRENNQPENFSQNSKEQPSSSSSGK